MKHGNGEDRSSKEPQKGCYGVDSTISLPADASPCDSSPVFCGPSCHEEKVSLFGAVVAEKIIHCEIGPSCSPSNEGSIILPTPYPAEVLDSDPSIENHDCGQVPLRADAANAHEAVGCDHEKGHSGVCSGEHTPHPLQNFEMWARYYHLLQRQQIDAWYQMAYAGMFQPTTLYGPYGNGPLLMGPTFSVPYLHFQTPSYP